MRARTTGSSGEANGSLSMITRRSAGPCTSTPSQKLAVPSSTARPLARKRRSSCSRGALTLHQQRPLGRQIALRANRAAARSARWLVNSRKAPPPPASINGRAVVDHRRRCSRWLEGSGSPRGRYSSAWRCVIERTRQARPCRQPRSPRRPAKWLKSSPTASVAEVKIQALRLAAIKALKRWRHRRAAAAAGTRATRIDAVRAPVGRFCAGGSSSRRANASRQRLDAAARTLLDAGSSRGSACNFAPHCASASSISSSARHRRTAAIRATRRAAPHGRAQRCRLPATAPSGCSSSMTPGSSTALGATARFADRLSAARSGGCSGWYRRIRWPDRAADAPRPGSPHRRSAADRRSRPP